MRHKEPSQTIVAASPDEASTVVHAVAFKGEMLRRADLLVIDALLVGDADGALDVYLQRKLGTDEWVDWVHFPQIAAASTKRYTVVIDGHGTDLVEIGGGDDATPGVGLAAGKTVNVIPGDDVRIVFVAGASTSAGAAQKITITPYTERR